MTLPDDIGQIIKTLLNELVFNEYTCYDTLITTIQLKLC